MYRFWTTFKLRFQLKFKVLEFVHSSRMDLLFIVTGVNDCVFGLWIIMYQLKWLSKYVTLIIYCEVRMLIV